jgi:hypothetical protein
MISRQRRTALLTTVGVVASLALGAANAVAAGSTLFVAPGGADVGNCQIHTQPCKTIGYALGQASSGATIDVAAGTYRENPLIAGSVSLVGASAGSTVIDGRQSGTTVTIISANATVLISNLTIQGGKAGFAGGISSDAPSLTLNHVTVTGNTATGGAPAQGGGLYATAGTVTLEHSKVTGNKALGLPGSPAMSGGAGGNGGEAEGGGIYVAGANLILTSSTVSGNQAIGGAGAAGASVASGAGGAGGNGGAAFGGGIFAQPATKSVSITRSNISGNTAQSGSGGTGGNSGDGTGGQGGAPQTVTSPLIDSTAGGGVLDVGPNLTVVASTISGNKALDGAPGAGGAGAASGGGGGNSGVAQCRAQGGGLVAANGTVLISVSKISSNTAKGCSGGRGGDGLSGQQGQPGGAGGTGGGGDEADGGGILDLAATTITNSVISNNAALSGAPGDGGNGGAGGPVTSGPGVHGGAGGNSRGQAGASQGGGVLTGGGLTLTHSVVSGNRVRGGDGGKGGNGGAGGPGGPGAPGGPGGGGGAGGIASPAEGGGLYDTLGDLLVNSTVTGNSATGGRGGDGGTGGDGGSGHGETGASGPAGAGTSGANGRGGGLEWDAFGTLTNDTIDGNSATGGTFGLGTPIGTAGSGIAGGVFLNSATLANSIVAQDSVHTGTTTGRDCATPSGGHVITGGHNLLGAIDACNGVVNASNGDQAGTSLTPLNPLLASLAANGGATQTMAEKPGSPAIGHGRSTTCTSTNVGDTDQRGYPRLSTSRGACDVGAYDSTEPERLAIGAPSSAAQGVSFSITLTPRDPFGTTVTSFRDTVHFTSTDKAAVLPADYTFTSADNGTHTFTVTLHTLGNQTISVRDTISSLINGTSGTIAVN